MDGKLIGTRKVENTNGQQTWRPVSCEVSAATGVQVLCLKFSGGDKPVQPGLLEV
jgi:arabinoxylan arabinofuranohydrolase